MNFQDNTPYDILTEKWNPVLNHDALPVIEDDYRKKVTAVLLENQEQAIRAQHLTEDMQSNNLGMPQTFSNNGGVAGYDPVLISLVRRAMPNLMAYDICGVQPMTGPTGLIFAMRANYGGCAYSEQRAYAEAMFQEPQPDYGGSGYSLPPGTTSFRGFSAGYGLCAGGSYQGGTFNNPMQIRALNAADFSRFRGMLTSSGEGLGSGTGLYSQFNQMAFSIDRVAVQARTRALSSNYTIELAQDLKAVHGLDAEAELANLLSTEILAEINREIVKTIYYVAQAGSQQSDLGARGVYDLDNDSDGRWSAERFRGLSFQIERECNAIAKLTRRGKGNFIICDSDTAAALAMSGFMSLSPGIAPQINADDTQSTFAGILNGKIRVYIDPYSALGVNFFCAGYKGESPYDAGLFYCPYVPLQMVRAVDPNTFQPRIGFKTRYGVVANPYVLNTTSSANGPVPDGENLTAGLNQYYRLTRITNLHGNTFAY